MGKIDTSLPVSKLTYNGTQLTLAGGGIDTPIYYDTPYTHTIYNEQNIPQSWRFVFREDGVVTLTTTSGGQPEYIETADGTYEINGQVLTIRMIMNADGVTESIINFQIASKNELIGQGDMKGWILTANSTISLIITKNGNYSANNYLVKGFNEVTVNVSSVLNKPVPAKINFKNYPEDTLDLSCLDTKRVDDMREMFEYCGNLKNISPFDTSSATTMVMMFDQCSSLSSLNLNYFNTSNVTDMGYMFNNCPSLSSLNIDNFDTANVTNMQGMFNNCSNLVSVNVSSFNTSNVTSMREMFNNCSSLTNIDISSFDTSSVLGMSGMFNNCSSLTNIDISSFDTSSVLDTQNMFNNCSSLQTIKLPAIFNECNESLGLIGLSNLTQILVPTPALPYYTDSSASKHCPYFTDNEELKNKIIGYDTPTTTYTFVTDGGTAVESITTNDYLQEQESTATVEGYILKGWYFDSSFTKKVKFPYLNINENLNNITLYAKYDEIVFGSSKKFAVNINEISNPEEASVYTITEEHEATGLGRANHGEWKSVWFKYTPTQDCTISLTNTNGDLNWQVIKVNDYSLVADNDPENAQVSLTSGTQYYIAIAIWAGRLSTFSTGFIIQ